MAVRIRLKRTGRRNRPFYRICVFDSRTRRDGKPIEELGSYDPRGDDWAQKVKLKRQRAHYWLTVGALPSETVASILRRFGVRKDGPVPEDEPEVVAVVAETAAEAVEEAAAGEPAEQASAAVGDAPPADAPPADAAVDDAPDAASSAASGDAPAETSDSDKASTSESGS